MKMMAFVTENSTTSAKHHHARSSRPRNPKPIIISPSDPKPKTPSQKPSISGPSNTITTRGHSNHNASPHLAKKDSKRNRFMCMPLGRLGCGSSSPTPVSAPEFIRSAADWEVKRTRRKKQRKKNRTTTYGTNSPAVVEVVPDVCCAPGIGFASDVALVDRVESRRPVAPRTTHRERSSSARRTANLEHFPILESPLAFDTARYGSSTSNGRQYHHLRRRSCGGLSEIMRFQSSILFGRSFEGYDRFGDWRLDVDNMSYEELLDLGDRIGYVGTGLREDEIFRCLRKTKHSISDSLPLLFRVDRDWNCCICQEGCLADEVGKLECGHYYHINCIKQWLLQNKTCPVCKAAAAAEN
ncbi:hypothetical protein L1049_006364 [Liquidambar formosana]|uniref:RING-type E3 ubiquitin transferase n=1 Tax=Liquidambar formosana TaxID=63359 RepID=A0AAP0RGW3_LIQFO